MSALNDSRVIVIACAKGGVGKTTVTSNLAVELAKDASSQVVVVDLDLQFGDVATLLDLRPTHTVANAFGRSNSADTLILKTFLTLHDSGFYVLCGDESPAANEKVTADQIKTLIGQLAAQFSYVLVDTGAGIDEPTLAACEVATDLVVISTMDLACIKAARKEIQLFDELRLTPNHRHLVLNFADRRSGMTVRDIEGVIGLPVDVIIPRSQDIPLAGNRGEPFVLSRKRGPAKKAVQRLAGKIRKPDQPIETNLHRGAEIA